MWTKFTAKKSLRLLFLYYSKHLIYCKHRVYRLKGHLQMIQFLTYLKLANFVSEDRMDLINFR